MQPSRYIVIPVHNRCATTLACLSHLSQTQVLSDYTVVVVDDGSTDGTAAAIRAMYPTVHVLAGDGNLWWTGAIGLGMTYAQAQGADVILWLNDDCLPEPGAIAKLVEVVQTQPRTIASAACYTPGGTKPLATGFQGRRRCAAYPGELLPVEGTSGYCVAIPRAAVVAIGYPDARHFPQYGGDGMYLLRATRAGFRVCLVGDAVVRLPGITDTIYRFQDYLQHLPTLAWQRIFFHKKSPYHLPTRFYYHRAKYGFWLGISLFLAQIASWVVQWFVVFFTRRIHAKTAVPE